ncbi:MAG: hypothetical protein IPQ07_25110 [Myxococcales bacterium]|nr:hypothetical protein [Myxococcales bacterium]
MYRALLLPTLLACAGNVHLEVGARHDTHGSELHAGASVAVGFGGGGLARTRHAVVTSVGADLDGGGGARLAIGEAYLGGGPGPLMYGARLSYLVGAGPRMGASLLYVLHEHDRPARCVFDYEHDCDARALTIGAVGLQLSGTVEDHDAGVVTDVVFELLHLD